MKKVIFLFALLFIFFNSYLVFAEKLEDKYDIIKSEKYDNISDLAYLGNGKEIIFTASKNGKYFIVKNGIEGKKYEGIQDLQYLSDGKSFIFKGNRNGKTYIVKDGFEIFGYDEIYNSVMSVKGEFSFIAKKNGKIIFVKNGKEIYNKFLDGNSEIIYSPDGKEITIVVYNYDSKKQLMTSFLIKGNKIINKYGFSYNPLYSADGKSFSFIASEDGRINWFLVKDGIEYKKYDGIQNLKYSPDGSGFIFVSSYSDDKQIISGSGKYFVVKDGKESNTYYENIRNLKYSPDGKSFVFYGVRNGKTYIVKDGFEIFGVNKNNVGIGEFIYSPNGKNYAFTVYEDKSYIIKDGKKIEKCNDMPIFSPDNKSFACIVYDKNGKSSVLKDGIESIKYNNIKELTYGKNNKDFAFIELENKKNYVVQYKLKSKIIQSYKYDLINSTKGIKLLQSQNKDISIIDVDLKNAGVSFGGIFENNSGSNSENKDFYRFKRNFSKDIFDKTKFGNKLFALVNGQFFNSDKDITAMSFPLKTDGKIITEQLDNDLEKRTLVIDNTNNVKIINGYDKKYLEDKENKEVLVAFNPIVALGKDSKLGRSYIGLKGNNNIIFFIAENKTTDEIEKIISDYGIEKENILMLDGGPSAQFSYKGEKEKVFYGTWGVPQFNLIYEK